MVELNYVPKSKSKQKKIKKHLRWSFGDLQPDGQIPVHILENNIIINYSKEINKANEIKDKMQKRYGGEWWIHYDQRLDSWRVNTNLSLPGRPYFNSGLEKRTG